MTNILAKSLLSMMVAVAVWLAAPMAQAQDSLESLSDKVARLQRELSDLQAQFYGGAAVSAPAGSGATGVSAASQEVRLQALETQMRTLTGQLEEMNFRINQVSERLDRLVSDVDFRLRALEQGGGGTGALPPPDGGTGAVNGNTGVVGPLKPPAGTAGTSGTSGGQPGVLGTLPAGQVPNVANSQQLADEASRNAGGQAATSSTAGVLPKGTPQQQYDHAYELLRQGDYAGAEAALKSFIAAHPDDKLTGNAHYWLGETFYVRKDYASAARAFADGLKKFPKGNKAADSLLKMGMSLSRLDRKADACKAFGELSKRFPDSAAMGKLPAERTRAGCA